MMCFHLRLKQPSRQISRIFGGVRASMLQEACHWIAGMAPRAVGSKLGAGHWESAICCK